MTASQRQEPGDPRAKAIEAMARVLAGEPKCYCDDDWRVASSAGCPRHGDGPWPNGVHRIQARKILAALEAEGWGLTDTREAERLREAEAHLWALVVWFGGRGDGNPYVERDVLAASRYVSRYCGEGEDMPTRHREALSSLSSVPVEE